MVWDINKAERFDLSPLDKDIIGRSHCRLYIPLGEPRMMKLVGDEIRRALFQIEVEMETISDRSLRGRLLRVRQLIHRCNEDVKIIAEQFDVKVRDGRPKTTESCRNKLEVVSKL